jgi:hypothetical protein
MIELFILIGGAYALYTVGMAIATELDYRAFNRSELKQLRKQNDTLPRIGYKTPYNRRVESRDSEEGDIKVKEAGKPHWS